MKILSLFGVEVRIDPLLIALAAPAFVLGLLGMLLVSFVTVLLHEFFHVAAAALFGIKIREVQLMPFGGVAKAEAGDIEGSLKEFFIALAGPAGNFLIVGLLTLIANSNIELAQHLRVWIMANLAIGAFNLLPCYPLDGGRMLRALLTPIVGIKRATNMCTTAGIIIGFSVTVFAVVAALLGNMLNLSLVAVGIFIVVAAHKERKATPFASMQNATGKRERIKRSPINERRIAAGKDTMVHEVIKQFSGSSYHTVTVLDENMDVMGSIGENELIKALLKQGGRIKLGDLVKRRY